MFRWTYISSVFAFLRNLYYIVNKSKISKGRKCPFKVELFITNVPMNLHIIKFCLLCFLMYYLLTYEECRDRHQQHLLMHQKLSHRLLYVLGQHQGNNEMDVFHLQLVHFQIHHLLYWLYLYIYYQVYVFVMFVELKVNQYNKLQHN